ncbi:MAG: hypothetical protein ABFD54_05735 [Armatimonadota bacterium]|nr:hypothetical protein [bacterium]
MPEIKWLRKGGTYSAKSNPATKEETPIENKTVPELKGIADGLGIDLAGITKKADILAAIQAAEESTGEDGNGKVQE